VRAALAAELETLPTAALAGPELDLRLLVDHREKARRTGTPSAASSDISPAASGESNRGRSGASYGAAARAAHTP
jgi:hypothetical protein